MPDEPRIEPFEPCALRGRLTFSSSVPTVPALMGSRFQTRVTHAAESGSRFDKVETRSPYLRTIRISSLELLDSFIMGQ